MPKVCGIFGAVPCTNVLTTCIRLYTPVHRLCNRSAMRELFPWRGHLLLVWEVFPDGMEWTAQCAGCVVGLVATIMIYSRLQSGLLFRLGRLSRQI